MKKDKQHILTFTLTDHLLAIPLQQVVRVIRAVAVTTVPDAGDMLYGVFDFHGDIIPVINLRKRFCMDPKPVEADDRFVIINTPKRKLSMVVDEILDIREASENEFCEVNLSSAGKHQKNNAMACFMHDNTHFFLICDMESLINYELELQLSDIINMQEKERQQ